MSPESSRSKGNPNALEGFGGRVDPEIIENHVEGLKKIDDEIEAIKGLLKDARKAEDQDEINKLLDINDELYSEREKYQMQAEETVVLDLKKDTQGAKEVEGNSLAEELAISRIKEEQEAKERKLAQELERTEAQIKYTATIIETTKKSFSKLDETKISIKDLDLLISDFNENLSGAFDAYRKLNQIAKEENQFSPDLGAKFVRLVAEFKEAQANSASLMTDLEKRRKEIKGIESKKRDTSTSEASLRSKAALDAANLAGISEAALLVKKEGEDVEKVEDELGDDRAEFKTDKDEVEGIVGAKDDKSEKKGLFSRVKGFFGFGKKDEKVRIIEGVDPNSEEEIAANLERARKYRQANEKAPDIRVRVQEKHRAETGINQERVAQEEIKAEKMAKAAALVAASSTPPTPSVSEMKKDSNSEIPIEESQDSIKEEPILGKDAPRAVDNSPEAKRRRAYKDASLMGEIDQLSNSDRIKNSKARNERDAASKKEREEAQLKAIADAEKAEALKSKKFDPDAPNSLNSMEGVPEIEQPSPDNNKETPPPLPKPDQSNTRRPGVPPKGFSTLNQPNIPPQEGTTWKRAEKAKNTPDEDEKDEKYKRPSLLKAGFTFLVESHFGFKQKSRKNRGEDFNSINEEIAELKQKIQRIESSKHADSESYNAKIKEMVDPKLRSIYMEAHDRVKQKADKEIRQLHANIESAYERLKDTDSKIEELHNDITEAENKYNAQIDIRIEELKNNFGFTDKLSLMEGQKSRLDRFSAQVEIQNKEINTINEALKDPLIVSDKAAIKSVNERIKLYRQVLKDILDAREECQHDYQKTRDAVLKIEKSALWLHKWKAGKIGETKFDLGIPRDNSTDTPEPPSPLPPPLPIPTPTPTQNPPSPKGAKVEAVLDPQDPSLVASQLSVKAQVEALAAKKLGSKAVAPTITNLDSPKPPEAKIVKGSTQSAEVSAESKEERIEENAKNFVNEVKSFTSDKHLSTFLEKAKENKIKKNYNIAFVNNFLERNLINFKQYVENADELISFVKSDREAEHLEEDLRDANKLLIDFSTDMRKAQRYDELIPTNIIVRYTENAKKIFTSIGEILNISLEENLKQKVTANAKKEVPKANVDKPKAVIKQSPKGLEVLSGKVDVAVVENFHEKLGEIYAKIKLAEKLLEKAEKAEELLITDKEKAEKQIEIDALNEEIEALTKQEDEHKAQFAKLVAEKELKTAKKEEEKKVLESQPKKTSPKNPTTPPKQKTTVPVVSPEAHAMAADILASMQANALGGGFGETKQNIVPTKKVEPKVKKETTRPAEADTPVAVEPVVVKNTPENPKAETESTVVEEQDPEEVEEESRQYLRDWAKSLSEDINAEGGMDFDELRTLLEKTEATLEAIKYIPLNKKDVAGKKIDEALTKAREKLKAIANRKVEEDKKLDDDAIEVLTEYIVALAKRADVKKINRKNKFKAVSRVVEENEE